MNHDIDALFHTATSGPVSDVMKWLVQNKIIHLTDWSNKFHGYIPFDFRIDRAGSADQIDSIGEKLADRVIEIEKMLGTEFDSMLCSLYSGIFGGVGTALWLKKKYNRNIKVAVSRRDFNQETGANAWSIHPLKEKKFTGQLGTRVLIHDEMTNTGNTLRDLLDLCHDKKIEPLAIMIIADRIPDPLPANVHVRMIDGVPCYSMITADEIIDWCIANQEIWQKLYKQKSDADPIPDDRGKRLRELAQNRTGGTDPKKQC